MACAVMHGNHPNFRTHYKVENSVTDEAPQANATDIGKAHGINQGFFRCPAIRLRVRKTSWQTPHVPPAAA